jgi:glutamate N-acetyltransferase/amino-acid N-acetyltransferase
LSDLSDPSDPSDLSDLSDARDAGSTVQEIAGGKATGMNVIEGGSVLSPRGFRVGWSRSGLKQAKGVPDVALIVSDGPAAAAAVFTRNKFAAASVEWNRSILPTERLRAVVVNSGNANACTGEQGRRDVRETAALVAELLGCLPEQVAVASTGIIGHPLPMKKLTKGVRAAFGRLSTDARVARSAERAIMTTDTRPKACAVEGEIDGAAFRVGGMAKGSGMIAPDMATMLAFVTTDAHVPAGRLREMVGAAADRTFNRITVDGDSSTNDTALAMASGASGAVAPDAGPGREAFQEALLHVMGELARAIVRDGEGATKLIEVRVSGARSDAEAAVCARAIAESQLVKCAIHGGDPNWGRIVCAAGYCGVELHADRTGLEIGGVTVFRNGLPTGEDAAAQVAAGEVVIRINLGAGHGEAAVWTCDLSKRYVEINAEYHT